MQSDSTSAGERTSWVVAVVGSSGQIGRTVVRRRTAGVAMDNGTFPPGVTMEIGRDVVVLFVVTVLAVVVSVDAAVFTVVDLRRNGVVVGRSFGVVVVFVVVAFVVVVPFVVFLFVVTVLAVVVSVDAAVFTVVDLRRNGVVVGRSFGVVVVVFVVVGFVVVVISVVVLLVLVLSTGSIVSRRRFRPSSGSAACAATVNFSSMRAADVTTSCGPVVVSSQLVVSYSTVVASPASDEYSEVASSSDVDEELASSRSMMTVKKSSVAVPYASSPVVHVSVDVIIDTSSTLLSVKSSEVSSSVLSAASVVL